ncbi:TIGR03084 family metal-binding protein [Ilumatobacter sp.]|uniref:TIGR03084 family metal-binding protein n=1 Tax=Ilumatobacter sp. TaxID=1967498 RepID=UPI003B5169A5
MATTSSPTAASVRDDLIAEQEALDPIVADLDSAGWGASTPSERWTVADQIGHLAFFDRTAAWAITDEERFRSSMAELTSGLDPSAGVDEMDRLTLGEYRAMSPDELLEAWRANRRDLADAAAGLADDDRVVWYGPSMGAKSFLTARLMECWAHGQHVVDALGVERDATDRLAHIVRLGVNTRGWTYVNRGLDAPETPVRLELDAPSGGTWTYGPDDAEQSVRGPAEDFCLVVTQCRHVDATDLVVEGDAARDWMSKAQAFAGAATSGPPA